MIHIKKDMATSSFFTSGSKINGAYHEIWTKICDIKTLLDLQENRNKGRLKSPLSVTTKLLQNFAFEEN